MSRKTSPRGTHSTSSSSRPAAKPKQSKSPPTSVEKPKPYAPAGKPPTASPAPSVKPAPMKVELPPPTPSPAGALDQRVAQAVPAAPAGAPASKPFAAKSKTLNETEAADQVLNRAERDIASAIESLNTQMNAALTALAGLASTHTDRGKAVVRTAPLDRATATFQRLVAEVLDDQYSEMLPPLIALRNEMQQWAGGDVEGSPEADFHRRGVEALDGVLAVAGAAAFDARPGQPFDPLIHLPVGECRRADLADGAVAECLQAGFRSGRGKVLTPARVRVNRR